MLFNVYYVVFYAVFFPPCICIFLMVSVGELLQASLMAKAYLEGDDRGFRFS